VDAGGYSDIEAAFEWMFWFLAVLGAGCQVGINDMMKIDDKFINAGTRVFQ
jgi:hypothetical protein